MAKWMAARKEFETPIIRKEFTLENFEGGAIRICGLGFFELWVNGVRVGEEYFKPVWTDYNYRDLSAEMLYPVTDSFRYRRYYLEYDLRGLLQKGRNVMTILLGNGWYRQNQRNIEGNMWYAERLKVWFDLEYTSNGKTCHVGSDESLIHAQSHIVFCNMYFGERHDYSRYIDPAALDADESAFVPMEAADEGGFLFEKQPCPNDALIRTISPKELKRRGARVFDAGENITGWAVIRGAHSDIRVSYAEEIDEDGALNFMSAGGKDQISRDEYRNPAPAMVLRPMFHWNAFRYCMVEGDFEEISIEVVHQNAPVLAEFKSSDERLNWLYDAYIRTQLNNFHCGVPSDCPHRERLGYTGDGWLTAQSAMMLLDVREFYKKWIRDIFDGQDPKTGHVQHTAPFYGGGGGPGGWGGAAVWMPYFYYEAYRDEEFLREAFPHIRQYLSCMESFSEGGLVVREIEGGWCLGDWCTPDEVKLPEPFVNTFFYIRLMKIADEIAAVLREKPAYADKIAACTEALIAAYYDGEKKTFCGGVQGADAFAAELGLNDLISFDAVAKHYEETLCFDTGIFGTYFLIKQLAEKRRADLAFALLTSEKYPSFGHMRKHGATTIWESWDGGMSHDHPMFAGCIYYLMQACLGVKYDGLSAKRLIIEPQLLGVVTSAAGTVHTPFGKVSVQVSGEGGSGTVSVTLPVNTEAELIINGKTTVLSDTHTTIQF